MFKHQFSTRKMRDRAAAELNALAAAAGLEVESFSLKPAKSLTVTLEKDGYCAMIQIGKGHGEFDNSTQVHWCVNTRSNNRYPASFLAGVGMTRVNNAHYLKATSFAADFKHALELLKAGFSELCSQSHQLV